MGQLILENTVTALSDAGIPARRGYPSDTMPVITQPVAAVSLKQAQLRGQTLTVLVRILSPGTLGASACEEAALAAGEVMTGLGGECAVSQCSFDGRTGLFSSDVTTQFLTEVPVVKINGTQRKYVEAFTCWRTVDEDAGITELDDAPWYFRLEEFFPADVETEDEPEEPFLLTHSSITGTEMFRSCRWTYQRRIWGSTGIRQIRLGSSKGMVTG